MNESLTLPVRSRDDFRRTLAGIVDPDRRMTAGDTAALRETAKRVVVALCLHFGRELDRKTLWSRIDSALQSACARVSDGDRERWLDLLLEHVRADPVMAAACPYLLGVRAELMTPDEAHRKAFLRYVESRRYAVIAFGRAAWHEYKQANAATLPREVSDE